MSKIHFSSQTLTLNPEGTAFWHEESMLIVADLCLSAPVPRSLFQSFHDNREILERLEKAVRSSGASRILFLGSGLGSQGREDLGLTEIDMVEDICAEFQAIWVHEDHNGWIPSRANLCEVFTLGGLTFRHKAMPGATFEISGCLNPETEVMQKGRLVKCSCFVEDGLKLILPGFCSVSGGTNASHYSVASNFPGGHSLHAVEMNIVRPLTSSKKAA